MRENTRNTAVVNGPDDYPTHSTDTFFPIGQYIADVVLQSCLARVAHLNTVIADLESRGRFTGAMVRERDAMQAHADKMRGGALQ